MAKQGKILEQILRGSSDANIKFTDLCSLLKSLGFDERVKGSQHIFTRNNVQEIINL